MPVPYDWNELDQAIFALQRSKSALPDVYRALPKGELCALMPYHPELDGTEFKLENGMEFPFVMFDESEGPTVALFSSEARAEEGMNKGGVAENTFCVATLRAEQMLEILGTMNLRASLNKSCATGSFFFGPDLMRDLVNGKALEPLETDPTEERTVDLIDPADYPTDVIQPLFETLRRIAASAQPGCAGAKSRRRKAACITSSCFSCSRGTRWLSTILTSCYRPFARSPMMFPLAA
jgi:hypothetical protein